MDFDADRVSYSVPSHVGLQVSGRQGYLTAGQGAPASSAAAMAKGRFLSFFRTFHQNHDQIYARQLLRRARRREFFLEVDLDHLAEFDAELRDLTAARPEDMLAHMEEAAKALAVEMKAPGFTPEDAMMDDDAEDPAAAAGAAAAADKAGGVATATIQVLLRSSQQQQSARELRSLGADSLGRLVCLTGIVVAAARVRARASYVVARCSRCGAIKTFTLHSPMANVTLPAKCDKGGAAGSGDGGGPGATGAGAATASTGAAGDGFMAGGAGGGEAVDCGPNPYVILPDHCRFVDQQTLKLQEAPEAVPTGEMPRSIMLSAERFLVDKIAPGTRVTVIAVAAVFQSKGSANAGSSGAAVRTPYLRMLGVQEDSTGSGRASATFSQQEEERMRSIARGGAVYERIWRSIAPAISGDYTVDLKKAIACMLFGGSRKKLPDGVKIRGDVNVLLMGDPSTAKSQLLKFVEKAAPVGVYTSGKGSSAAGLTAAVIRDSRGEFYLEAGAMVLADGGVICIDEFDKMRESDRVAIHEAMEQQTISVAKAGIVTMLNSRVSVLAAANPVFGRYDDLRSASENIDLMATILSRFDLIFIVRDVRDPARDRQIAEHVLRVNMRMSAASAGFAGGSAGVTTSSVALAAARAGVAGSGAVVGSAAATAGVGASEGVDAQILDVQTLKRFVMFCRAKCAPRLSEEAAATLASQYVQIRDMVRQRNLAAASGSGHGSSGMSRRHGSGGSGVPITVRQLEALVRLAESQARMRLDPEANVADVEEAIRLFRVSTFSAASASPNDAAGSATIVPNPTLMGSSVNLDDVLRSEEFLRRRMTRGATLNTRKLLEEGVTQGFQHEAVRRAVAAMVARGEVSETHQGKMLRRVR